MFLKTLKHYKNLIYGILLVLGCISLFIGNSAYSYFIAFIGSIFVFYSMLVPLANISIKLFYLLLSFMVLSYFIFSSSLVDRFAVLLFFTLLAIVCPIILDTSDL
ncbi:MAG: hypothetical protein R3B92_03600 [Patescibacteria group bacterium]